jgi:hypothetical protein
MWLNTGGVVIEHNKRCSSCSDLAESTSEFVSPFFLLDLANDLTFFFGAAVDPAKKKRIDNEIKEAKIALATIEQEMQKITDNFQKFNEDGGKYNKDRVHSSLQLGTSIS